MSSLSDRRARVDVRVFPSTDAQDRDDPAFWAALPVEVRVLQVWKLSEAQWRLRGEFPDEPGLVDLLRAFVDHNVRLAPGRIDILTDLTGLTFEDAWPSRVRAPFGPIDVDVVGREAFIRNKRATGRARDLGDVESLGE